MVRRASCLVIACLTFWSAHPLRGQTPERGLAQASLEELMNLEIRSVSRKQEKLARTAAAVFVITQDDIARSGATSLPEVLRLAPGLQVARIDPNKWAVSSRGFNGRFANKMLVLIDGRSIYTPAYSGVYWEQHDILLEDIDRIEVIRGPGATVWGANAVNGVINIITKTAAQSPGGLVTAVAGPREDSFLGARYAGKAGRRGHYRVSTKLTDRADMLHQSPIQALGSDRAGRGGGRFDFDLSERDSLMVQGDLYRGGSPQDTSRSLVSIDRNNVYADRADFSGGFAQAEWRRKGQRTETALSWFLNQETRRESKANLDVRTVDFDLQQQYALSRRQDLVWGAGFRSWSDHITALDGNTIIQPPSRQTRIASSFIQDDIQIVPDRLIVSIGTKMLHQQYTGMAWQPGARLLWAPNSRHSVWGSLTRAVRMPSRRDQDISSLFTVPPEIAPEGIKIRYQGNRDFQPETVMSVEAGYRRQFGERLSLDLALFRSQYGSLESLAPGPLEVQFQPTLRATLPLLLANGDRSLSRGGEIVAQWRPKRGVRVSANYSFLNIERQSMPNAFAPSLRRDPRHQVQTHLAWDIRRGVTLDGFAYGVSATAAGRIPAYVRADVRLAWRAGEHGEFSVGGRNLLDARHLEFQPEDYVVAQEVRRSAYLRFTWRF